MKKAAVVIMSMLCAVGLCFSVYAFAPQRINSLHPEFANQISVVLLDGEAVEPSGLGSLTVYPGAALEIVLAGGSDNPDLFLDQNGLPIKTADVTASKMRAANIAYESENLNASGIRVSTEITVINAGGAAARPVLRILFPHQYNDIAPMSFSLAYTLSVNGEVQPPSRLAISGSFGNRELALTSSDTRAYAGTAVLAPVEDIASISLDAGSGVTVEASLYAGGRYLLSAGSKTGGDDARLLEENRHVVNIITLDALGFNAGQIKSVSLDMEQNYFVYDAGRNFIGRTSEALPFSEKFYILDKAIEF